MNRILAVKSYGFEWSARYGLTETQAATAMRAHAVDWVALQNLRDPLPTTAVVQEAPAAGYDDRRFRDAMRGQGLRVFEATAVLFRPDTYRELPDMRPVDASGCVMEPFGWYVGLCPSSRSYVAERAAVIEEVAATLQPDGVFLTFIRFPGFWELWMPETRRDEIVEYCFCDRCLARFSEETGHVLPEGSTSERSTVVLNELRADWTRWKCDLIAGVIGSLGDAARRGRPGAEVLVNGIALGRSDYGNAVSEVLGQAPEVIGRVADHIELMFYHQIMRRDPAAWIASLTAEMRARTTMTLLACLQGKPDYLERLYATGRRRSTIAFEEYEAALRAVAASPADGLMVYHWVDFLEDERAGDGRMVRALRAFKAGELSWAP
jgi:hypothetical protein